MQTNGVRPIRQWLATSALFIGLVLVSAMSTLFLYGSGSWQVATGLEASKLAQVEVSELVGTSEYSKPISFHPHTWLRALVQTTHMPFANPIAMLFNEFPTVSPTVSATTSQSQSSLFGSLSAWQTATQKIALGWAPLTTPTATIQMIQQNPGITVISPSWLQVQNANGEIANHSEASVVQFAHSHHVQVWALFDNRFDASLTHQVLGNVKSRRALVDNVVTAAKIAHLDGINVDFENLLPEDQAAFTTFVAELHHVLQPLHITLSVDITPDIVFLKDNAAFFHAGLASVSDYVVLMAYDEHWSADQTPGPVADVPWVTNSVYDLLDTGVPADKLIMGLPFYTRFWHIHADGSVTSQAIADASVSSILAQHHATPKWIPTLDEAYARYPKSDGYEEVWYETTATLKQKLNLVSNQQLAGVAVWSLSLSDNQTWHSIVDALRQALS